jgi:carotenoid cleavage dioxygenase-like enzyme
VFYLSPYLLRFALLRQEGRTTLDALAWEPQRGSRLLLVERETGTEAATVPVGRGYCLHLVNAFEDRAALTVDVLEFERPVYDQYRVPGLFTDVSEGRPVRYVVDVPWGTLRERRELGYRRAPDFPSVAPGDALRPYRDFWMLGIAAAGRPGRKFFNQLAHADWDAPDAVDVYQAPRQHYLAGEPVVVPDPREKDRGVVLCPVFDAAARTSAFLLFDARAVARGPVAVLRLRSPVHLGFHATFQEQGP